MTSPVQPRKLRILALHGYAQNGTTFQRKLIRLQQRLEHSESLSNEYPGGVEIICPDGVLSLAGSSSTNTYSSYETPETGATRKPHTNDLTQINPRGWWKNLDITNRYEGLLASLEKLSSILRAQPCDGIIGFSQGATLATMLAALCEGTPARRKALAAQGDPIFLDPPQGPFKFALLSCGYKGTDEFYRGFYAPRLTTPVLFDTATLDHMVGPALSDEWTAVGKGSLTVSRVGGHWFPTDERSLAAMVSFAARSCESVRVVPTLADVESESVREDSVIGEQMVCDKKVAYGRLRCGCRSSCRGLGQWRSRCTRRRSIVVRGLTCRCIGLKTSRSVGLEKGY